MKSFKTLLPICIVLLPLACSDLDTNMFQEQVSIEESDIPQSEEIDLLQAQQIARTHLVLDKNLYVLKMNFEEAANYGISREIFTRLLHEVEEVNDFINDLRTKGEHVILQNPQEVKNNSKRPIKTRSESNTDILASGSLEVRNIQTEIGISAPAGSKKIVFKGSSRCFLTAIQIDCNGSTNTITSGPWIGSCSFQIPMSPTLLKVRTFTLCSDGGSVQYFIYNHN